MAIEIVVFPFNMVFSIVMLVYQRVIYIVKQDFGASETSRDLAM